jgi:hypothetical protein
MNKIKQFFVSLVAVVLVANYSFAQDRPMYEVHSMMVYNFIKYIEWPSDAKVGEFVIGVIGDNDVYNTLEKWYGGKDKMGQKIVIKKFNSAAEVNKCHLVYVASNKSNDFENLKNQLNGSSTLIVTDKKGLAEKGSGINFRMEGNKLKFEMNQNSIESAKLKVSGQLTSMAILI